MTERAPADWTAASTGEHWPVLLVLTALGSPSARPHRASDARARRGASPAFRWGAAALLTALSVYFYAFMEWLFLVTKPSFLETLDRAEQVRVLLGTALPPALAAVASVVAIALPHRFLPATWRAHSARWLGFTVAASVLACCFFLLIDNFTYTLFQFGALTATGSTRVAYAVVWLVLFVLTLRKLCRLQISRRAEIGLLFTTAGLMLASLVALGVQLASTRFDPAADSALRQRPDRWPNILLLASDGVEASHMSAYGYSRDTTPFLARASKEALVAENAFPNGTATAGSVVSMLTSKFPIHTRVYQYQNILRGEDAYEHLPGILRDFGYRTITVSVELFSPSRGNPRPWNMRNAFDNYESLGSLSPALAVPFASDLHFFGQMLDRITDRLLHTSGEREARLAFAEFVLGEGQTDPERMREILDFIDASSHPFFAHLHFMGTHPPYRPRESTFAGGETESQRGVDEYDSAVRTFDEYAEAIFSHLRETGRLANTLIVVTSDHGRDWKFSRVPMMFFFPAGEHRGVIRANTQLLDIAPTILDYMGLSPPPWMEGESLLRGEPDPLRPIWTVTSVLGAGPPYPQMGRIGITVCDRSTWLKPRVAKIAIERVPGHTQPCPTAELPPPRRQWREIVDELARAEYEVSHLRYRGDPDRAGRGSR